MSKFTTASPRAASKPACNARAVVGVGEMLDAHLGVLVGQTRRRSRACRRSSRSRRRSPRTAGAARAGRRRRRCTDVSRISASLNAGITTLTGGRASRADGSLAVTPAAGRGRAVRVDPGRVAPGVQHDLGAARVERPVGVRRTLVAVDDDRHRRAGVRTPVLVVRAARAGTARRSRSRPRAPRAATSSPGEPVGELDDGRVEREAWSEHDVLVARGPPAT